jgi:flagellar biosynthesis component FlhA
MRMGVRCSGTLVLMCILQNFCQCKKILQEVVPMILIGITLVSLAIIGPMVLFPIIAMGIVCSLLKRHTPKSRELHGLQTELKTIGAEVREIKEQIADCVIRTY